MYHMAPNQFVLYLAAFIRGSKFWSLEKIKIAKKLERILMEHVDNISRRDLELRFWQKFRPEK